jgi:dienelactone hydrolase
LAAKITRRQLGLTASALLAQSPTASTYTGALDGYESKVDPAAFDPVLWTRKLHESAPLRLTFRARNRKEAEAWQKRLRAKLTELVGGFPSERGALRPQTLETREFPAYRREKFIFESRPGVTVLAYLLTPAKRTAPHPVMICVPGHGRGVDDIVGIDDKGRDRTDKAGYQHDFALQAAEHGMAALAIEPLGFGCRRDPLAKKAGLGRSSCQPSAGAALLLGETMIAWRVWDVMRTIDWIETRRDLDARRVGCMGISGGGTCTLFSAGLEPRIQVAFVSGYLNTFRDSVLSLSHCIDNYVPGILNWAEMYDVAGLIAPRPLFVESGDRDNIFPVEASRASFERTRKVYEAFDAASLAEQEVFSGEHSFHGVRGLPFVARHLRA